MRKKERKLIPCACNCGELILDRDNDCRVRRFKNNHWQKLQPSGPDCVHWKGNNITKGHTLHYYIRKYFPPPKECQDCGQKKPLDAACVTGIYNRDFSNWRYLCRKCHIKLDDNAQKAWITRRKT